MLQAQMPVDKPKRNRQSFLFISAFVVVAVLVPALVELRNPFCGIGHSSSGDTLPED